MVHVRIATGAEQPINRDGAVSTVTGEEGDLVGMNADGELIAADADSATAVPAVGILGAPVDDLSNYPNEELRVVVEANRELINDHRIPIVNGGVIIENADEDWGFTPGQPVYLAEGGGYTQTAPSGTGDLIQTVGMATEDGEAVFLNVNYHFEVSA